MPDSSEEGRQPPADAAERQYWTDVEDVFDAALALDDANRPDFLDARCTGRPNLRAEVESLLAAHTRAGAFITPTSAEADTAALDDGDAALPAGTRIGAFSLVERIGQGGMGDVYAAERADGSYDQRVAIKLIAARLHGADVVRRFRAERQILASLQHPNIVSLLDGGLTEDGQPYIVMEYVDGVPIAEFCERRAVPLHPRLRLFQQVCAAVGFAHRHLVVHRDLKPANVLVTGEGTIKVLDFGVAKLLEPRVAGGTATVSLFGPVTPNYASPEQLRGLPVTTACDVYALGVMLYELLSGTRPYETSGRSVDEMLAIVVKQDPARPSAAARAGLPYHRRALRGDLDAVVLRAMAKTPDERYASGGELGEELERVLDGRPVDAQEPSIVYLARKAVARHRGVFAVAAVLLAMLVAVTVGAVRQARIAARERARAVERFNDVRELAGALIFRIHDEVAPLAGSTPVRRTVVAEGLKFLERLEQDSAGDPALQLELARAYMRIGAVQGAVAEANLGDSAGALHSIRKARELASAAAARQPSWDTVLTLVNAHLRLAHLATRDEAHRASAAALALASEWHRKEPDSERARTLLARAHFSAATASDNADARLVHWQASNRLFDEVLAADPTNANRMRNVALTEKNLGGYFDRRGDLDRALAHYLRALALDERRVQAQPSDRQAQIDLAIDIGSVGHIHEKRETYAEAIEAYRRSLEIRQRLSKTDSADVYARGREAFSRTELARVYLLTGSVAEAREHAERAVALNETLGHLGVYAEQVGTSLTQLADVQQREGRARAACDTYGRAVRAFASVERPDGQQGDAKANAERAWAACQATPR